jgi:hypothetical protein
MPVSRDAYEEALVLESLAQVYTWTGKKQRALELIEKLLTIPGYPSYGHLRVDPAWDPLRGDHQFESLLAKTGPVSTPANSR